MHQFVTLQCEHLFHFLFIQVLTHALLKGQPTTHHDLFAPVFILNNHHIIIKNFGDDHRNPKNKKT